MVKRVPFDDWLAAGKPPAMAHVFEHIGLTWPIKEQEKLLHIASITFFPPHQRSEAWKGYDQSCSMVGNVFYYPITASLRDSPFVWFRNLCLIQIRKKLNLITSLRVNLTRGVHYM